MLPTPSRTAALALAAAFLTLPALAETTPKALVCQFGLSRTLPFEGRWIDQRSSNDQMSFTFAALDDQKNRAQVIANQGASAVLFISGDRTWNFIEFTPTGAMMSTTVFKTVADGLYPAVHSRHPVIADKPLVSQRVGTCERRD